MKLSYIFSNTLGIMLIFLSFCSFADHIRIDLAIYTAKTGSIETVRRGASRPNAFSGYNYVEAFLSGNGAANVLERLGAISAGGQYEDCTHLLDGTVQHEFIVNNDYMGCDPAPGRNKKLHIEYVCVTDGLNREQVAGTRRVLDIYDEGSIAHLNCQRAVDIQQNTKGTRIWNGKLFDNAVKGAGLFGSAYALYNLYQIGKPSGEADYSATLQNISETMAEMSQVIKNISLTIYTAQQAQNNNTSTN